MDNEDRRTVEIVEAFRSTISAEKIALRGIFILNGGSAIGMLTFIAQTDFANRGHEMARLLELVILSGFGAAMVVVAAALGYHSQRYYLSMISCRAEALESTDEKEMREAAKASNENFIKGSRRDKIAIACAWTAIAVFFVFLFRAVIALRILYE